MQPALARFACRRPFARAGAFFIGLFALALWRAFAEKTCIPKASPRAKKARQMLCLHSRPTPHHSQYRARKKATGGYWRSLRSPIEKTARGPKIKAAMTANAKCKASVFAPRQARERVSRRKKARRTRHAAACLQHSLRNKAVSAVEPQGDMPGRTSARVLMSCCGLTAAATAPQGCFRHRPCGQAAG